LAKSSATAGGIVGVIDLAGVIALQQTDDLAAANVDGRIDLQVSTSTHKWCVPGR